MAISSCGKRAARQASAGRENGLRRDCTIMAFLKPGKMGRKLMSGVELLANPDCGLHHCALKMHNPTRDMYSYFNKILRVDAKNSPKKECFFWSGEPDKLLKTKNIKIFLRKTNPSEPEKHLKTKHLMLKRATKPLPPENKAH